MLLIAFAKHANGMLAATQVDCKNEGCSVNKCPQPKDQKKRAANKKKFSEQKKTRPEVVMNPTTTSINGVLLRIEMVLSFFGNKLTCWCGKKDFHGNTTHTYMPNYFSLT